MSKRKQLRSLARANLSALAVAQKTVQLAATDGVATSAQLVLLPVLPASPFCTNADVDARSGLTFVYDANALIAAFNEDGRKLNLGIEHAYHTGNSDTRSRGAMVALTTAELEPDQGMQPGVLYGWFELSTLGAEELDAKAWLYGSAETVGFWVNDTILQITKLTGHTLTNNPATLMPANFTASAGAAYTSQLTSDTPAMDLLTLLLQYLGLPADTTADQAAVALQALINEEADDAADGSQETTGLTAQLTAQTEQVTTLAAQVTTLQADLTAAQTALTAATAQVASLQAAESQRAVFAAVDAAIAARKATPAQRDSLVALATADLTAFTAAYANATPVLAGDTEPTGGAAASAVSLTAEEIAFCKDYGFSQSKALAAKQQRLATKTA